MADAPKQLRLTDETFEKFKQICTESKLTAQQTMDSLLLAYETGMIREETPETRTDIDSFILHLNAIQESYLHMIQLNKDSEDRAKLEFSKKIESKEQIIHDLQAEREENKVNLNDAQAEIDRQQTIIKTLEEDNSKLNNQLEDKQNIIAMQNKELEKLNKVEELERQNKALAEEKKRLLEDKELAERTIINLKTDLEKEKSNAELERQKAELDKEKAEVEKDKAISKIKEQYTDDVRAYEKEIASLKDRIRQLETGEQEDIQIDLLTDIPTDIPTTEPEQEEDNPDQLTFED